MRIAVTGGSGNIGQRVCRELRQRGHDPVCLDLRPPATTEGEFRAVDLCAGPAAMAACEGVEAVVHLAAIPNPFSDPPERVMGVNTMSTLNVFEAARKLGIRRVVYACSESATGFGIHVPALKPLYLPVDEQHPCWPHETYSLSKYFGELIGENYARAYGLEVLSLRYTWVWFAATRDTGRNLLAAKRAGARPENPWFGAYISVGDVARAVVAAVAQGPHGSPCFEAFLLTARDTFYSQPTIEVLKGLYGGNLPPVRDPGYFAANPHASVFDIRKAERLLSWRPQDHLEDVDSWDLG
jgi:nucleoside-diphosphate-sugar epimerase